MSLDITVHHFNVDSSPPPSIRLLEAARKLVDAATVTASEWRSIVPIPTVANLSSTRTACFVWGRAPPVIDRNMSDDPELYDWDAPIDEKIMNLNSLPEFEETDFRDIVLHPKSQFMKRSTPRSDSPSHGRCLFAKDVGVSSDTQPRKRLQPQVESLSPLPETISISKLIPFPHYYESPDPALPPPPEINQIPEFPVARGLSSVLLTTPFARTAWLVPLRGVPPVEGASCAQLENVFSYKRLPPAGTLPRTIQWTPAAVTQFWTFMLRQRSANNFGPIALAYMFSLPSIHKAEREEWGTRPHNSFEQSNAHRTGKEKQKQKTKNKSILEDAGCDKTGKAMVWEFIKIYHDSQYAMKLRSLLDSFRWEEDTDGGRGQTTGGLPLQYRVLRAARLMLVDETGKTVLLA